MNFKSLFIVDPNEDQTKPVPEVKTTQPTTSFPTSAPSVAPPNVTAFPSSTPTSVPTNTGSNRFLNDIVEVYNNGFEKLNQPGYDFFEYYRAVMKAGVDNSQVYQMAFDMAQGMDNTVSKQSLLTQSEYYIGELQKVHATYQTNGNTKLSDLTNTKNSESQTLTTDINSLREHLEIIKKELTEKETSLAEIDNKYQQPINDIREKLSANDTAKDIIISSINKVKNNINNNLK